MAGRRLGHLMGHALLIVIGIIWIYPFIWMVSSSLKSNLGFYSLNLLPKALHFDNYSRAWNGAHFSIYFFNTAVITFGTVIMVLILCSLTGYAIGRVNFPGRRVVVVFIAALMFVPKGYTVIPLFELVRHLGLNNTLLGIIFAEASGAHVLFILMFAAYFRGIPKELEDAAAIDGCGFIRTFALVMLPTARPIIATTGVMQFIWSWNSFLIPLVLTISSPNLRTLAVGTFSFVGNYQTDYTAMAAAATISIVPIIIVFIVAQRQFMEGVAGAVKQ